MLKVVYLGEAVLHAGMWDIVLVTNTPYELSGDELRLMGANRLHFTRVYISGNRATYSMPIPRYNRRGHNRAAAAYSEVNQSSTQCIRITF